MKQNIHLANVSHADPAKVATFQKTLQTYTSRVISTCRVYRKRVREAETIQDLSDEALSKAARFTDGFPLKNYDRLLHLCPRLVNVVTVRTFHLNISPLLFHVFVRAQLAEAIPLPSTGLKLPLDLHKIASRCSNAYFAPKRFAAVQLAFANPRCRVLVFRERVPFEPFGIACADVFVSRPRRHGQTRGNR